MKITTWYEPEPSEVEVEVSFKDILYMIQELAEPGEDLMQLIRTTTSILREVTDDLIKGMTDPQKQLIRNFLEHQAKRYI